MDQPHSKEVSEMEAAHISPELPIRWVVSADRTVEIKEEVTELGCDQANERILQEETPPSSITERVFTVGVAVFCDPRHAEHCPEDSTGQHRSVSLVSCAVLAVLSLVSCAVLAALRLLSCAVLAVLSLVSCAVLAVLTNGQCLQ
ncbi:UNVERIFIED_CONTAM: hypothetical protein FKN15_008431 [Acipenser sinensis]